MAAVDDDELGDLPHLAHLAGREVHPVAEHHARDRGIRAVAERPFVDPVTREVHDAVGRREEGLDDLGAALGDERLRLEATVPQGLRHVASLLLGGRQGAEPARGVPDDERPAARRREHVATHRGSLELSDQATAHAERLTVLLRLLVVEQLPGIVRRAAVDEEYEVVRVGGLGLEVVGEEQLEERPGGRRVGRRRVDE